jgi:hypothetical protein
MSDVPAPVAAAAKIVEDWLAKQKAAPSEPATARPMSAMERYKLRSYDQDASKLPAWQDPRGR